MAPLSSLTLLALLSIPGSLAAQEGQRVGDLARIGFEEQRQGGALASCNLTFVQVFRDDVSRQNALVTVQTMLALVKPQPGVVVFMLKMVGKDQGSLKGESASFFSPSFAYLSAPGYSSAHREHQVFQCEGPGFCASYAGDVDMKGLLEIALSPSFTTSFQREPGSLDVAFLVRVPIDSPFTTPAQVRFTACVGEMIRAVQ